MPLNPSQHAVASNDHERAIVLAGAGTGKTTAAIHWIAERLKAGVKSHNILMVTFTKKAANQMRLRLTDVAGSDSKHCYIGTYHAVASRLLRKDPNGFGLSDRNFSILDSSDANGLIRSAFRLLGYKPKSPLTPSAVQDALSYSSNTRCPLAEVAGAFSLEGFEMEVGRIVQHYQRLKQQAHTLDYDDLLLKLLHRLQNDEKYAKRLHGQFQCVLVDEFQDNNKLNYAIIKAINPEKLLVIGDKQQSIYGFRGAHAGLVEEFIAEHPQANILKLEDNYRSGQSILDLANEVIKGGSHALTLKSALGQNSTAEILEFANARAETEEGLARIKKWLKQYKPTEITVLCRSSRVLIPLEFALKKERIPYKKYGGVALTDSAEIKDFLSVLRITDNPKDSVALMRALCLFPGIGRAFASKMAGLEDSVDVHALLAVGEKDWPPRARELQGWLKQIAAESTLGDKGKLLYKLISPYILMHYPEDHADRLHSLQELVSVMEQENSALSEFLEVFILDQGVEAKHPETDITLSTIHSAKGLEWDSVILFNASADIMPSRMARGEAELEEEKRLMYVALTRARHELLVTANDEMGGLSPFVSKVIASSNPLLP